MKRLDWRQAFLCLVVALFVGALALAMGCTNTLEGIGRDIKGMGEGMRQAAAGEKE